MLFKWILRVRDSRPTLYEIVEFQQKWIKYSIDRNSFTLAKKLLIKIDTLRSEPRDRRKYCKELESSNLFQNWKMLYWKIRDVPIPFVAAVYNAYLAETISSFNLQKFYPPKTLTSMKETRRLRKVNFPRQLYMVKILIPRTGSIRGWPAKNSRGRRPLLGRFV